MNWSFLVGPVLLAPLTNLKSHCRRNGGEKESLGHNPQRNCNKYRDMADIAYPDRLGKALEIPKIVT